MDEIAKAGLLRDLKQHSGWGLVEEYIRKRMTDHHDRLLSCGMEDVTKHRERHAAYKSVFDFVDLGIQDGQRAMEDESAT